MADFADFESSTHVSSEPGTMSVLMGWVGAGCSIALVVGLGVWGYQLAVRDVSGVPVVRALEGPMTIQPDDPGGSQAAHQGLAVNSVAAVGSTEAPADRLVLAPAPLDLSDEDLPRPVLSDAEIVNTPTTLTTEEINGETPAPAPITDMATLADSLAAGVQPLDVAPEPEGLSDVQPVSAISPNIAGVSRSPIPRPRPVRQDATALAIATDVALTASRAAAEVEASSVPAGTRLVQFGAYDSPDIAREVWAQLDDKFGDFLKGKQRVVQEAVSGGKTFYRLRAMGFVDINDARRFCAALVADRQACIPVVVR